MSGLHLLLLAASCALAYGQYNGTAYYNEYHHDEACLEKVPEGLSVPSMCFMYEYVGECEENGYNPHELSQYLACAHEFLSEEEIAMVDEIWNSAFGPGGAQAWDICSEMGYDIAYLNQYATCMEHTFGVGYSASNAAFLEVNVTEHVPEIDWSYFEYYPYDPEDSFGPSLPEDPIGQMLVLLHSISMKFVDGYNMCPYEEYMCPDRSCIPDNWECDGIVDCDDGADELLCGNVHDDYWWYGDDDDDDWYWNDYDWYSDPWFTCEYLVDSDWCDGYHDCEWDEAICSGEWLDVDWEDPWYTCEYLDLEDWCDNEKDCEFDEGDFCWYEWDDIDWNDPWYSCEYLTEEQWCDDMQDCAYDEGDFCWYEWDGIDWNDPWYTCEYLNEDQWCNEIKDCEYDEGDFCWYDWEDIDWEDPWYSCEYLTEEQWCDDMQDCEYDEGDFCDWDDNWGSSDVSDYWGWDKWSWDTWSSSGKWRWNTWSSSSSSDKWQWTTWSPSSSSKWRWNTWSPSSNGKTHSAAWSW